MEAEFEPMSVCLGARVLTIILHYSPEERVKRETLKIATLPSPTCYASGAQQRRKIEKPSMLSGLRSVSTPKNVNI